VLIQDSTIIRLHEKLADIWPATRSRNVAAGVKVAVLTSAIASGPKSVALFSENTNEIRRNLESTVNLTIIKLKF
jgi:putative transposase